MREFSNSITIGWCGVATGASPSRRDIEPTDIPYLLSGIVLLDVYYDPLDFEYRLIGGEVVKRSGNLEGKRVRQASLLNVASMAYRNYCDVVEIGIPQFLEAAAISAYLQPGRPWWRAAIG